MTLTAFRIAKKEFAKSIWLGLGAKLYGGRWNSIGVAVADAAENRSLAALEQLVHLIKPRVLRGFVISCITFQDAQMQRVDLKALPDGWNHPVAPPALKQIGDAWVAAARFPVLAAPSAIVPGEWNYLINPAHKEFQSLQTSRPASFIYDELLR